MPGFCLTSGHRVPAVSGNIGTVYTFVHVFGKECKSLLYNTGRGAVLPVVFREQGMSERLE